MNFSPGMDFTWGSVAVLSADGSGGAAIFPYLLDDNGNIVTDDNGNPILVSSVTQNLEQDTGAGIETDSGTNIQTSQGF